MPCFVCAKCGCIENTALCNYWSRRRGNMFVWPEELKDFVGMPLCSECGPVQFVDGTPAGTGQWHNQFPKEHWSKYYKVKPVGLL